MAILEFFVDETKIDKSIIDLEGKKRNLSEIVEHEIKSAMLKKFSKKDYSQVIQKHKERIIEIKDSLYKKYISEIDLRLQQLYLLKKEVY